jgi:hypothetical protein
MSKEREVLSEALEWMHELRYVWANVRNSGDYDLVDLIESINKIERILAQPKRKPLSDEEIFEIGYKAGFAIDSIERDLSLDYGFLDEDGDVDNEPYFKLVRAIEKAHGITGIGQ